MASKHKTENYQVGKLSVEIAPHPGDPTALVGPIKVSANGAIVLRGWWNGREIVDAQGTLNDLDILAVERALTARKLKTPRKKRSAY